MKVVRIYHRKDLVEQLEKLINHIKFIAKCREEYVSVWGQMAGRIYYEQGKATARYIRQHRIRYGIYSCF